MNSSSLQIIAEMRILIGFLGEKNQEGWWNSSFFASQSRQFLMPIVPNSILLAQYNGVCTAASIIHDEHIGIGKHYHLYRLSDSIERSLLKLVQNSEFTNDINKYVASNEDAIGKLECIKKIEVEKSEGPIAVGDYSDANIDFLLEKLRAHYMYAIKERYKTFPYMRCA